MKRHRIVRAGALIPLLVALGAIRLAAQDVGLRYGTVAPSAEVETLDGKTFDLGSYAGKTPMVMEFWATWCPNCKELQPTIESLHAKYGKTVKFIGVAVSVNETSAAVKQFVEAHKMPGEFYYDRHGKASGAYEAYATSYVVVFDKSGKVVYTGLGGRQAALETAIKKVAGG
jgi:thiol-disulfide isomerase/thioredoxin